jgi:hypothetical protein
MFRQVTAAFFALFIGLFLFLQFRQSYFTTRRQSALEAQIQQFLLGSEGRDAELARRLDALEVEVFGELPAAISKTESVVQREIKKPRSPELWQRTRDAELRRRVKALEEWRMHVDTR